MQVIIGVDGSKYGRWAVQWVPRLPLNHPAKVVALHALDLVSFRSPFVVQPVVAGNEPFIQAEIKRLQEQARKVAAETKLLLASAGLQGKVLIERGVPAPTVLHHARRGDLIVLGSRGLHVLDRFMLGSVSSHVSVHAPCSVLVIKQAPRALRRILFATDGSNSSGKALRFLTDVLKGHGLEAVVVHIMPFLRYPELKEAGQAILDRETERLVSAGYTVKQTLKLGQAADEIIKTADRQKVDLLVVGAKGLGAIARFFLGSVSTRLLHHSATSVLIVR